MTRALPRIDFNSSGLARLLAGLDLGVPGVPGSAFAARLGEWVDAAAAMRLYAAHHAGDPPEARPAAAPDAPAAMAAECARLRASLEESIVKSCAPGGGARLGLPAPDPGASPEIAADYEPYRRFHLAHQREMEARIGPLRARVRAMLASSTPALGRLAALDAALDGVLAGRESRLLAALPALLERRFEALRTAPRQAGEPAAWLARFREELRSALLAELDLRLQPVAGLIDAGKEAAAW